MSIIFSVASMWESRLVSYAILVKFNQGPLITTNPMNHLCHVQIDLICGAIHLGVLHTWMISDVMLLGATYESLVCTDTEWHALIIISVTDSLTHWGRVMHTCVSKLTIIGSDNGLSPGWHQAIIWTNAGILSIGPLGTNVSQILIEIYTLSFKKMDLKMSSGKWQPVCLSLNLLIYYISRL